jgi:TRAP-type mannitol/chloroaromatic compound transport system permease small subunit
MSTTAMLDIVGGIFFLFPFIGLFGPGAWDLDSTNVVIAVPVK